MCWNEKRYIYTFSISWVRRQANRIKARANLHDGLIRWACVCRRLHWPLSTDHGPRTTDYWPLTTDHWLLTTDHGPLTTDHWPLTTDHRPRTTDHWPRTTDQWPRNTDHGSRTTDHWPQTTDHGPLTTDHWPRTTDHWPLTTDHGLRTEQGKFANRQTFGCDAVAQNRNILVLLSATTRRTHTNVFRSGSLQTKWHTWYGTSWVKEIDFNTNFIPITG